MLNGNSILGNINYIVNSNGDEFVITRDRSFLSVHMVDFTCTWAKIDIYHGIFADSLWILDSSYTFACLK